MTATKHNTERNDDQDTQRYLDLLRSVTKEWEELEDSGDESVQLSSSARSTIRESVRAAARHGSQIDLGATQEGPFTMSELALRTLIRGAVDRVPGAQSLKTRVAYPDAASKSRVKAAPDIVTCIIAVSIDIVPGSGKAEIPDLQRVAGTVGGVVRKELTDSVGLDGVKVDVHIADLYYNQKEASLHD